MLKFWRAIIVKKKFDFYSYLILTNKGIFQNKTFKILGGDVIFGLLLTLFVVFCFVDLNFKLLCTCKICAIY